MRFTHLTPADYRVMPWANGRGQTVELIRLEDAAGALRLRLSVADVTEAGAFSRLPGIDRILTLIEGDGFDLEFSGAAPAQSALPFQPIAFSGDWSTSAVNLRGPSRDFNVMTSRGRAAVEVALLPPGPSLWPPQRAFSSEPRLSGVYVVAGSALVGALGLSLRSHHLLLIEGNEPVDIDPVGQVLALRLNALN